jgi:PAS domain-containing protein
MNDVLIYTALIASFLLMTISFLMYRKIKVWKVVLLVLTGLLYGIYWLYSGLITFVSIDIYLEYYSYFLFGVLLLFAITMKKKIRVTQNLTDYDFFEMEKDLDETKLTSELLRLRFISTIGLLQEGLIFYNDDLEGLFVTEQVGKIIGQNTNEFSMEDYANLIHPEDKPQYVQAIKKVSKKNPGFDIKYRIKRDSIYVWIEERAKIFEFEKKLQIISVIQGIDMKLFPQTLIHEIDSLPSEQQLIQFLTQIVKEPETFYLVMIQLTNIPDINNRFGRDVGNLMIGEYIKKMRFHFAKD